MALRLSLPTDAARPRSELQGSGIAFGTVASAHSLRRYWCSKRDISMDRFMIRRIGFAVLFVSLCAAPIASAQKGSVEILSPADGATLDPFDQNRIRYQVVPGSKADHVHLYVDGKEAAILRELKGSHTLQTLSPGPHELCIKVVNKAHVPLGVQRCINVHVE
jgi:hypothetical protein